MLHGRPSVLYSEVHSAATRQFQRTLSLPEMPWDAYCLVRHHSRATTSSINALVANTAATNALAIGPSCWPPTNQTSWANAAVQLLPRHLLLQLELRDTTLSTLAVSTHSRPYGTGGRRFFSESVAHNCLASPPSSSDANTPTASSSFIRTPQKEIKLVSQSSTVLVA